MLEPHLVDLLGTCTAGFFGLNVLLELGLFGICLLDQFNEVVFPAMLFGLAVVCGGSPEQLKSIIDVVDGDLVYRFIAES